jgi:hypothetical protein
MSTQDTLNKLSNYCKTTSGDTQIWSGKSGTYYWNRGKETSSGLVNGVVRKLAGIESAGHQIWVVAGSFKIAPDGTILRFTGLPKAVQKQLSTSVIATIVQNDTVTV